MSTPRRFSRLTCTRQYGENKAESLLRGFGGKEVFLSNHDDIIEADSVLGELIGLFVNNLISPRSKDFASVYSFDTQDTQAAWIPALAYFTRFNVDARNNPRLKLSVNPHFSAPSHICANTSLVHFPAKIIHPGCVIQP